jgi:membrane protein YdbS with pleckstrin-like domain
MLTPEEEKFLQYWEANRIKEKSLFRQLSLGMPLGVLIGLAILLNFMSGWYTRANMVAYSQSTPYVLIVAIVIIAVFCSVFYKRYKWEMNEQHFLELKIKKERGKSFDNMQQKEANGSQIDEH